MMEANPFNAFGSWLKLFCPTCLTEKDHTALSAKVASRTGNFGSWLRLFCPTCLTEKDRIVLSEKAVSKTERFGSWLKLFCPTCPDESRRSSQGGPLLEAFMSSGNCL